MSICWFLTDVAVVVLWRKKNCFFAYQRVVWGQESTPTMSMCWRLTYYWEMTTTSIASTRSVLFMHTLYCTAQQWIRGKTKNVILQISYGSEARQSMLSYSSAINQRPDKVCYFIFAHVALPYNILPSQACQSYCGENADCSVHWGVFEKSLDDKWGRSFVNGWRLRFSYESTVNTGSLSPEDEAVSTVGRKAKEFAASSSVFV